MYNCAVHGRLIRAADKAAKRDLQRKVKSKEGNKNMTDNGIRVQN
jgi:hypothetical protein